MTTASGPSRLPSSNHRFRADEALTKNAAGGNGFDFGCFRPMLSVSFAPRMRKLRTHTLKRCATQNPRV